MIYTTINNWGGCCYICFKAVYFDNLTLNIGRFYHKPEIPVNAHFQHSVGVQVPAFHIL